MEILASGRGLYNDKRLSAGGEYVYNTNQQAPLNRVCYKRLFDQRERERERDLVYGVGEETLDRLQKNKYIIRKKKKKKGLFFLPILSE